MTNDTAKKITAKFSGRCTKCHGTIPSGTQCMWERGAGVRHVNCDNPIPYWEQGNGAPVVAQQQQKAVAVTMGVFKKDGRIYVVKPNKDKTRVYAKEIVESPARMTENGAVAQFEAVYAKGVVFNLTEADRWDIADAQDFLTKFSKCIVCGRHLKAAKSVACAIGPVCRKYFAHNKNYDAAAFAPKAPSIDEIKAAAQAAAPVSQRDRELNAARREQEFAAGIDGQGNRLNDYWVDDAGRAHSEPEIGVS